MLFDKDASEPQDACLISECETNCEPSCSTREKEGEKDREKGIERDLERERMESWASRLANCNGVR